MMITYSEFGVEQMQEVVLIYQENGWVSYLKDFEQLERALKTSGYLLGAFYKQKLVGFIRCVTDGEFIVFIQDLILLPEFQRQGIGTLLLQKVFEKYQQVRSIVVITDKLDAQANAFYQKNGLKLLSENSLVSYMK